MITAATTESLETTNHSMAFLTNYAMVLIVIDRDENIRMREMAKLIGITERAVQRIVEELIAHGYLKARKAGRRNMYSLSREKGLIHPVTKGCTVEVLLNMFTTAQANANSRTRIAKEVSHS